ncbi:MAG: chemotaxis protein CheW [Thiogranum sp.]|nr:chemotaxis protein CheW [Thiogranum sp.]
MSDRSCPTPLARLAHLEQLCLSHAHGLPQQEHTDEEWIGIGFRLGNIHLVAPLAEVAEILTPPPLSRVPRTKAWVCGIANVRGNLMPIMDLQAFLHDQSVSLNRRSRVLVVNHNGVYSGLVVDAVLGLRHFREDQHSDDLPGNDDRLQQFMTGAFRAGDRHWGVFSMYHLAETPQFLQAAV